MPKQASLFLYFLIAVTFILVGCGADIDRRVTFYRDEAWKAEMEIRFPADLVALLAASPESLEAEIAQQVAEWEAEGAQVKWNSSREDATLIYTFEVESEGLELLNEIVFEDNATITATEVDGRRQINFSYFGSRNLVGANNDTLTLQGGEIISSNGEKLNNGTVQWANANGRMNAVLTEKSRSGFATFFLIVLVLGGLGGGFWYYRQKNDQSPPQVAPVQTAFCANCGTQLSPQAKFCPICGYKQ